MSAQQATPHHASEAGLHRHLTAGQMAMVAVGGSIGTGLLLGSAAAVQIAGPAVILTYLLGAVIAGTVTMALGEMASVHPAAGSFGVYAEEYLNPWAGFVARYAYWTAIVIAVGSELVASATYTAFWFPHVPAVVWIAFYAVVLIFINTRDVGNFGSFEYWFAMLKVVVIIAFIVMGAGLLFGGRVEPQFSAQGGFMPNGPEGPLRALSFALFSFLGIEMVAISSGEARSRADIPRATRNAFLLLSFIYIGAIAVLVGVMPWNRAGVTQSPFVTVFEFAGIPAASSFMNFVVLTAALSGANASLYVSARMLFSLSRTGHAPAFAGKLNRSGSPRNALIISMAGIVAAILLEYRMPQQAYLYLIGASLFGGMLAWCIALAAHIGFRRGISTADLPMRSPGGAAASWFGLIAITAAVISTWWVPQSRITAQAALPVLGILTLAYFLHASRKRT